METFSASYRRMIDAGPSNAASWTFFVLLWPLALVYRAVVSLRAACYRLGLCRVYRAAVPVISVGNLTVGGTGKTPVVDLLAKKLLAKGVRVAVVSRGYGGRFRGEAGCVAAGDGALQMSPQDAGDEPFLLAARNPGLAVYVARKRKLGVRAAERAGARVVILDDGFQHLAVHRDVNIALLDARAPFGNGRLLPAGPLREAPAALRRADLAIMTHAGAASAAVPFAGPLLRCRPRLADALTTLDGTEVPWTALSGKSVLAFAGIARPEDFFRALQARGVVPTATLAFDDHQDYSGEQLNRLVQSCDNVQLSVTTEKDAVKLRAAGFSRPCLVAPLVLEVDEPARLDALLTEILDRMKS
ncbi:MAG: tetraacyldisaccharide 4'-kinase [Deltaproteobacteria bacterium]|nr:MAG: tetraacyldisaccharide 4'-kinase [Deltaproteobacteria bacterium]